MKDKLRIGMVSPLTERIPPHAYGGTERVVSWLTEQLVKMGHDVTLFASADSLTSAKLIPGSETALRLDSTIKDPHVIHLLMLSKIFREYENEFDIIHNHVDYHAFPFLSNTMRPVVTTLHGRLDYPEYKNFLEYYKHLNLVSISNNQRTPVPNLNWSNTVYHGQPKNLLSYKENPGDYFLFLGRITEEKRPDIAINLARQCGVKLKIAAKIDKVDVDYYKEVIKPIISDPLIDFVGEVGDKEKQHLLGNAKALLNTIDWPEPFGLVMIEALACGTPVITRRCGSTPEIIEDGKTGFICDSDDDFVFGINNIDSIKRADCRHSFETRFTDEVMAKNYVEVYKNILSWKMMDLNLTPTMATVSTT